MRVLLVGNYRLDQQESMQRFAAVLLEQLSGRGIPTELLCPGSCLGGLASPQSGLGKWLGYVDKLWLFPIALQRKIRHWRQTASAPLIVHICDHSNAIYTRHVDRVPHLVTCNDLLAIRSALGEVPANRTRWSGRQLQRIILNGLNRARRVTCISEATLRDLLRLSQVDPARADVTEMGLNYPYSPMPGPEAETILAALFERKAEAFAKSAGASTVPALAPFLLHVGGNQWYKNRLGVLQIYAQLLRSGNAAPRLVMAGKPFTTEMVRFVEEHRLQGRVVSITGCHNEELRALYSRAELLLFPSLEEGFGWPIVEAQACGCRVVTTNKAPMTAVGGDPAAYVDPSDLPATAATVRSLIEEGVVARRRRIQSGLENAARFSTDRMIEKYLRIYRELTGSMRAV